MEEKENVDIKLETDKSDTSKKFQLKGNPCASSCKSGCHKLNVYDWLEDINEIDDFNEIAEIRFKNTRKAYYLNPNGLRLKKGDTVAVESSPGHDIGIVSITGPLVWYKMQSEGSNSKNQELKKIYRKAKPADIDKWKEAIDREHQTMIKSRQIASDLELDMKIGDVEFQGDGTKAIFYYIADDRVDFRQLIKVLAEQFKIRIEMRQIGARQEAGRIGGIGSCGRELCCASWVKNFVSVTTNAARYQEVSLNPQKLAGQCSKLKCCLNYELDVYLDAQKDFPNTSTPLKTKKGIAYHQKTDVFKRLMWYMYQEDEKRTLTCMTVDTVKEVISNNEKKIFPEKLQGVEESAAAIAGTTEYQSAVGIESLTRFEDKPAKKKNNKRRNKKHSHKGGGKQFHKNQNKNKNKEKKTDKNQPQNKNKRKKPTFKKRENK